MTVSEEIFRLNAAFQKSYYDTDGGFFQFVAPRLIKDIKDFILSQADENHKLWLNHIDRLIVALDNQTAEIERIAQKESQLENKGKDHQLNRIKENISSICWKFHHELWNFEKGMLNNGYSTVV
jgi:hypothetical protein